MVDIPKPFVEASAAKPILVNKPVLPPLGKLTSLLEGAWERNQVTNDGPLVRELERSIRERLNISYPVRCVSNGGLGLQILVKALGIKGEVVTTPFSYVATSSCLRWEGCQLVFADIDEHNLTIDPEAVAASITSSTEAIFATHVYGNPCDIVALEAIGKRYGIPVVYDAAHAFGVRFNGESLLSYGDASMMSLHATKVFHSIEGGFVVSRHAEVDKRVEWMRRYGHNGPLEFQGCGINAKLSEVHAAVGICMLDEYQGIIEERKALSALYDQAFADHEDRVTTMQWREGTEPNFSFYPVVFSDVEKLVACFSALTELGVSVRRYFHPSLDSLEFLNPSAKQCQVSRSISERILCLPLCSGMRERDVEFIVDLVLQ